MLTGICRATSVTHLRPFFSTAPRLLASLTAMVYSLACTGPGPELGMKWYAWDGGICLWS
jgi:hypothetical protein